MYVLTRGNFLFIDVTDPTSTMIIEWVGGFGSSENLQWEYKCSENGVVEIIFVKIHMGCLLDLIFSNEVSQYNVVKSDMPMSKVDKEYN